MTNDPFYLIGRRAGEARADEARADEARADEARADEARADERMANVQKSDLRAKDSGGTPLRTLGWGAAVFGSGMAMGWIIKEKFS
jgi:anti-sigma factor RsiW